MLAKKPTKETKETKTQNFIAGSSPENGLDLHRIFYTGMVRPSERELKPVVINFDVTMIQRIDKVTDVHHLTRTAFIISAVAELLRRIEERGE